MEKTQRKKNTLFKRFKKSKLTPHFLKTKVSGQTLYKHWKKSFLISEGKFPLKKWNFFQLIRSTWDFIIIIIQTPSQILRAIARDEVNDWSSEDKLFPSHRPLHLNLHSERVDWVRVRFTQPSPLPIYHVVSRHSIPSPPMYSPLSSFPKCANSHNFLSELPGG